MPPEELLASHSVEKASSSPDSIPESGSLPSEDTHAIKSDCRVSVRPQPDEMPYQELGLDPDGDSCDRGIEPDTDGLDTAARIEADPRPEVVSARSEEQVSDPTAGSDPTEDPPDHPLPGRDTGHLPSDNGGTKAKGTHRSARSRTLDKGMPQVPSSDYNIGQLRQRITKGSRPRQRSNSWVKGLFRGVFR